MSLILLRRTASAATLTLALAGLAACGGDDSSASDPSSDSSSSSAPDEVGEADGGEDVGAEETEAAVPTAGEEIDASDMADVFKQAFEEASTATIAMSIGGAAQYDATGVVDFTTTPVSMAMAIELAQAPQPIEMIIVDGFIYQNLFGDKFTKMALDDPSNPAGNLSEQLDIGAQFDTFEKAITAATYVGEEDGLERYSLVLDSAILLQEQGADVGSLPAGSIPDEFTYDLWFDQDGLFRKMESNLGGLGGDLTATYDNWGEPVEITAPDASQIVE
ncbi:hypothetical protein NPS01_08240 [Nocardioides psychrotolerans]|uniref:LppX_LprAFG lipoprotein n=1 Tax=Nocardioides psychrotolerans TaxID=1005945 RepID=A0A1I3FIZ7_9ACTN|nr:hypothetical protein [Nocardioides psychrotolerans]GEP37161.1 hypothetical protein NPS01_08240 [Nocardioides psychrotolerans]SFI11137.1 hypothetical protein SAMN05216561_1054 [Nocardioides psychrotolerans]